MLALMAFEEIQWLGWTRLPLEGPGGCDEPDVLWPFETVQRPWSWAFHGRLFRSHLVQTAENRSRSSNHFFMSQYWRRGIPGEAFVVMLLLEQRWKNQWWSCSSSFDVPIQTNIMCLVNVLSSIPCWRQPRVSPQFLARIFVSAGMT